MALDFDSRHAPRRAAQYLDLVKAVRSASDADETDWLEWKSQLDLKPANKADKSALVHIARAIVGFANRQPDEALRNVDGYGYFVVGVDPQGYYGVEEIDGVVLKGQIAPIVGDAKWSPTYVHVTAEGRERLPVLVIAVDPPRWGDPIACIRKHVQSPQKDVKDLPEASIFVRRWGQTDRAKATDLDLLSDRLLRRQQILDIDVQVQHGGLTPVLISQDHADAWVSSEHERLMKPLKAELARQAEVARRVSPKDTSLFRLANVIDNLPESRPAAAYRTEVDQYLDDLRNALPSLLPEAAAIAAQRLVLRIHNQSDSHLEGVQVRLSLPHGIRALLPQSAARASNESMLKELPLPPRLYGPRSLAATTHGNPYRPRLPLDSMIRPAGVPAVRPRVRRPEFDTNTVVFPAEDLRVRLHEDLAAVVVISETEISDPVSVSWTATATNMDGEARGTVLVPALHPKSLAELQQEAEAMRDQQ
ncbi:hypothetical protein AB0M86_29570 [Streptomyces sp. NPDC051639]|uniref:AlbA family DNA-binding domain-containing protein n=1 Tax=Streptomyces sp. NPDC051639 TaxID=3155671 RepID=UPI00343C38A9